jgi:GNAT superfamily N-acetyltransferase
MPAVETRDLTPERWRDVERLFGAKGACGGCWCMFWRQEKGVKWDDLKGDEARRRFRALVTSGAAHGALAYVDGETVGWCSFDRKTDYAKLARSPTLRADDDERVWAIPCFFVKAGHRGQGVAGALLAHAVGAIAALGGRVVEAYPVRADERVSAAFAWTGTLPLFEKAGFRVEDDRGRGKVRVRRALEGPVA